MVIDGHCNMMNNHQIRGYRTLFQTNRKMYPMVCWVMRHGDFVIAPCAGLMSYIIQYHVILSLPVLQ